MGSDSNGSDKVFEGLGIIQVQMPVPQLFICLVIEWRCPFQITIHYITQN